MELTPAQIDLHSQIQHFEMNGNWGLAEALRKILAESIRETVKARGEK